MKIFFWVCVVFSLFVFCKPDVSANPYRLVNQLAFTTINELQAIRIASKWQWKKICFGGFIEVENENRAPSFNKKIFPNHKWRGFVRIDWKALPFWLKTSFVQSHLNFRLEHESSHNTAGLLTGNEQEATLLIYDDQFRNTNLNLLITSLQFRFLIVSDLQLNLFLEPQLALFSRNIPEAMNGLELGNSWGFSTSIELEYQLHSKISFYFSWYYRYLSQSQRLVEAKIFENTIAIPQLLSRSYPVINDTQTNIFQLASRFNFKTPFTIAISYWLGNDVGFVDSRKQIQEWQFLVQLNFSD